MSAVCMMEMASASPRGLLVRTRCHPPVNSELERCSTPAALPVFEPARQAVMDAAAIVRKRIATRGTERCLDAVIFIELVLCAPERLQAGEISTNGRRGDGQ